MSIHTLEFQQVTFHYPDQSIDLFSALSISIGAYGGGKSTFLKLACSMPEPLSGIVLHPISCV